MGGLRNSAEYVQNLAVQLARIGLSCYGEYVGISHLLRNETIQLFHFLSVSVEKL